MNLAETPKIYYDPYDFEIDTDPYPLWRRMRDETPLYWNEKYEFWTLSRYDDVKAALVDWRTYSSAKGTIVELIKSGATIPPGSIIFEDPPRHDLHRSLLARVFSPKKMAAIEPQLRAFCSRALDPLVGSNGFDFVVDIGADLPMRAIGMLLGIPESDQETIRDEMVDGLRLDEDAPQDMSERLADATQQFEVFGDYIDWRMQNPSDDLMTELLNAEYEDIDGERKKLTRAEILGYIGLLAGAGNETTARLIGWTGKVLAEHPDQRADIAADRSLLGPAIEELLRYEPPSPVQARYVMNDVEWYGTPIPAGSTLVLLNASANRDERHFDDADRFDIHRPADQHLSFGYGIHHCLGAALARIEGLIALDEVLNRFPEWDIDWDHAVQARTSTVRGWESLPVTIPTRPASSPNRRSA